METSFCHKRAHKTSLHSVQLNYVSFDQLINKGVSLKVAKCAIQAFVVLSRFHSNEVITAWQLKRYCAMITIGIFHEKVNVKFSNFWNCTLSDSNGHKVNNQGRIVSSEVPKCAEKNDPSDHNFRFLIESWFLDENAPPFTGSILYCSSLFLSLYTYFGDHLLPFLKTKLLLTEIAGVC